MNRQLLDLAFVRRKDRKSLFFIIALLLFSSFVDELYFLAKKNLFENGKTDLVEETYAKSPNMDNGGENLESDAKEKTLSPRSKTKALEANNSDNRASNPSDEEVFTSSPNPQNATYASHGHQKEKSDAKADFASTLLSLPKSNHALVKSIQINPNDPSQEDLIALGVPERVAATWSKYVTAGGNIKSTEDLEKIYGLRPELIESIKSNIRFPKVKAKAKFNRALSSIFINQASALEFARIPGIGPVLSERIIKFRDKLGGFHAYAQLSDVFGIEPEILEKHKSLFLIEKAWSRININDCDEGILAAHSYCNFRTAKAIINYREQHGSFSSGEDLLKIRIIDQEWLDKIAPYLTY